MKKRCALLAVLVSSSVGFAGRGAAAQQREFQRIHATNPGLREYFGQSIATNGQWLLVGIPRRAPAGAAAFFRFDANEQQWEFFQEVTPSAATSNFGNSVSLDGHRALIGSGTVSRVGSELPSAYVYEFNGKRWIETQRLTSSAKKRDDLFGDTVAIDGDHLVVGAPQDSNASGAAYVFAYGGTSWSELQPLHAFGPHADPRFGYAVAIHKDVVAVGAPDDKHATNSSGHVYVFAKNSAGRFGRAQKLEPGDAEPFESFGNSVSISDEYIAAGADWRGDLDGAAYLFRRTGHSEWMETQRLLPPVLGGWFGSIVRLDGDALLVGAPYEDVDSVSMQGRAYLYRLRGRDWIPTRTFRSSGTSDRFCGSALSGATVVCGEELGNVGTAYGAGTAFLFAIDGISLFATPTDVVAGATVFCATSGGVPGATAVLALTNFGGMPTFLPLASGRFDPTIKNGDSALAGGNWDVSFDIGPSIPPGLSGQRIELTSYGLSENGGLSASDPAVLRIR
jgi:hypothetical protein